MSHDADLLRILALLEGGSFFVTEHAATQMRLRDLAMPDIRRMARHGVHSKWQPDRGTFRLTGLLDERHLLVVACAFRADVVYVVTVHPERRKRQ